MLQTFPLRTCKQRMARAIRNSPHPLGVLGSQELTKYMVSHFRTVRRPARTTDTWTMMRSGRGATIRFSVRLQAAIKARPLEQHLSKWIRDMQLLQIAPDEILGVQLVTLCRTQGDLDELKRILPTYVWNSTNVFNNRIVVSMRFTGGAAHHLRLFLQEMHLYNIQPDKISVNCLVSLCKTKTDLTELQKEVSSVVWNSTAVFNNRIAVSRRVPGAQLELNWWLREMRAHNVQPDEITGGKLVSLCTSVADHQTLRDALPPVIWNSACVFTNRISASSRVPALQHDVRGWIREMQSCNIQPDEVAGTKLVSMCRTSADLEEAKAFLSTVWNSTHVFTCRIALSKRIPGEARDLLSWIREMHLYNIRPDEITGMCLVSLCKSHADLAEVKRCLPATLWNSTTLFTNRIVVSTRILGGDRELGSWLFEMRLLNVQPNRITGIQLVSLCKTVTDLSLVKESLPAAIWNNNHVFTKRVAVSAAIPGAERPLGWWLQEMRTCSIQPDEATGIQFLSLCKTRTDLDELKAVLSSNVWNSTGVFTNRIVTSARIHDLMNLQWWLQEVQLCGINPDEHACVQLLHLCKTKDEMLQIQKNTSKSVWNNPEVFNKRIKVSALVSPNPKPLSYWLDELREGGVVPNELSGQLLLSLCTSKGDLLLLRRYFPSLVRDDDAE